MDGYGFSDLLLKITQVLALGCNPTRTARVVPRRNQPAGLGVALNLYCSLVHYFKTNLGMEECQLSGWAWIGSGSPSK